MTAKIHLICKANEGLRCVDKINAIYESEAWLLTPDEMTALKGGEALLHTTKSQPSHFGGTVLDVRPIPDTEQGARKRCVLVIQSRSEAKGVDWDTRGQHHSMAWTTGVVRDEDSTEVGG